MFSTNSKFKIEEALSWITYTQKTHTSNWLLQTVNLMCGQTEGNLFDERAHRIQCVCMVYTPLKRLFSKALFNRLRLKGTLDRIVCIPYAMDFMCVFNILCSLCIPRRMLRVKFQNPTISLYVELLVEHHIDQTYICSVDESSFITTM